ncbi:MAG: tetratricopeptide repeat protein, partial [Nitrospirota bacterium]
MSIDKSKILEAAQQYTIRGQIQKAIEEWKKLITDTPNDANIYNTIGDLCLKYQTTERGTEDAISYYIKAAEIFESSGFALKAIAVYKKV